MSFLVKGIFGLMEYVRQNCLKHILYSFGVNTSPHLANTAVSKLLLSESEDDENTVLLLDYLVDKIQISQARSLLLVFCPFADAISIKIQKKINDLGLLQVVFVITHLEIVLPIIESFRQDAGLSVRVLIIGASLAPAKKELDISLLDRPTRNLQASSLMRLFRDLKKLEIFYKIKILIIDYEAILGQKNSALLRRIFNNSQI